MFVLTYAYGLEKEFKTSDEVDSFLNNRANDRGAKLEWNGVSSFWGGLESGEGKFILTDNSREPFSVQETYAGGFVITKDLISDGEDDETHAVGKIGPLPLAPSLIKELEKGKKCKGYQFVLKDDDGQTYYEGRAYDPTGEYDESWLYETYRWGATYAGSALLHFPHKSELDIG